MGLFIAGLMSGIIITIFLVVVLIPKQIFLVDKSNFSFEETTQKIVELTSENEWSMPHHYNLQETMKKHGFEVEPVKVFSVCKPEIAHQILGRGHERIVSALMPCRLAVYESKDGKTYISRLNAGLFSKFLGKNIKKAMVEASIDNEKILESLISNYE